MRVSQVRGLEMEPPRCLGGVIGGDTGRYSSMATGLEMAGGEREDLARCVCMIVKVDEAEDGDEEE